MDPELGHSPPAGSSVHSADPSTLTTPDSLPSVLVSSSGSSADSSASTSASPLQEWLRHVWSGGDTDWSSCHAVHQSTLCKHFCTFSRNLGLTISKTSVRQRKIIKNAFQFCMVASLIIQNLEQNGHLKLGKACFFAAWMYLAYSLTGFPGELAVKDRFFVTMSCLNIGLIFTLCGIGKDDDDDDLWKLYLTIGLLEAIRARPAEEMRIRNCYLKPLWLILLPGIMLVLSFFPPYNGSATENFAAAFLSVLILPSFTVGPVLRWKIVPFRPTKVNKISSVAMLFAASLHLILPQYFSSKKHYRWGAAAAYIIQSHVEEAKQMFTCFILPSCRLFESMDMDHGRSPPPPSAGSSCHVAHPLTSTTLDSSPSAPADSSGHSPLASNTSNAVDQCYSCKLLCRLKEMLSHRSPWILMAMFVCLALQLQLKLSNELSIPPLLYLTYNLTGTQKINDRFFKVVSCLNTGLILIRCHKFKYDVDLWAFPLFFGLFDHIRARPTQEVGSQRLQIGGYSVTMLLTLYPFALPEALQSTKRSTSGIFRAFLLVGLILPSLPLSVFLGWVSVPFRPSMANKIVSVLMLIASSLDLIMPEYFSVKEHYRWGAVVAYIIQSHFEEVQVLLNYFILPICEGARLRYLPRAPFYPRPALLFKYKKQVFQLFLLALEVASYALAQKGEDNMSLAIAVLVLSAVGFCCIIVHPICACCGAGRLGAGSQVGWMEFSVSLLQLVVAIPPVAGFKLPFDLFGLLPIIFCLIGLWFPGKRHTTVVGGRSIQPRCICQIQMARQAIVPLAHREQ